MKKIILTFILLSTSLYAAESDKTLDLFNKIPRTKKDVVQSLVVNGFNDVFGLQATNPLAYISVSFPKYRSNKWIN